MAHRHMHTKEFMIGAAVGSLLGSVGALLAAPSTGKKLREDICDAYCNLTDKTQNLADRGKSLAKNMGCQTCDWANRAQSAVNGATKTVKGWISEEEEEYTSRDLLIGGFAGAIVGAAVGLLLAPKPGEDLRQDISDTYEDISERTQEFADHVTKRGKAFAKTTTSNANKWFTLAQSVINNLTEETQERGEDWIDHVKGLVNNRRISEVLEWAQLGYRAWHGLQSKKRR